VLIAYNHPSQPLQLDAERYDMVVLGEEVIAPYAKAGVLGQPVVNLTGTAARPLPYLGYAQGAYLGAVTDWILKQVKTPIHLDRVYETDMAEGLKVMALEGHGIAFLPESAVRKEVSAGALIEVRLAGDALMSLTMEVRAYREKPNARHPSKRNALDLWTYLCGTTKTRLHDAGDS
jgi:DNA-binding transcriptional LysR family regulator